MLLISFGPAAERRGLLRGAHVSSELAETTLNYPPSDASTITTIVLVVYIAFIFLSGRISDKVGREDAHRSLCGLHLVHGAGIHAARQMNFWVILIVELFMCLLLTINDGTLAATSPRRSRPTCATPASPFRLTLANAIFGSSASFISFWLIDLTGNAIAPAWYMVAIAVVAFIAMCMTHDHSGKKLDDVK